MKLEDFYNCIIDNNVTDELIILKDYKDKNFGFVSNQYIDEIAKQHNLKKETIEDLSSIKINKGIFDSLTDATLKIYKVDKFDVEDKMLLNAKNLIIVCNSISKKSLEIFSENIVEITKLEQWQIKDFLYSNLKGMTPTKLDLLTELCNYDIFRINNEIDRLKIFSEKERDIIFDRFISDGIYNDLSKNTIFNFCNAIITKNKDKAIEIYKELSRIDFSIMGLVGLLYSNFKNIISVQCNKAPSPETCGLKANQFWAIKNNINHYTKDQLVNIFLLLTNIDKQIKTGELGTDILLDYLLVYIFNE